MELKCHFIFITYILTTLNTSSWGRLSVISQGAVSQKMLTKRCVNVYARVDLSAPAIHSCLVPPTSAPHYCRPYFYTETATLPLMTERKLLLRLSLCIVPRRKESHPKLVCGHYYVVTVHNSQQMVILRRPFLILCISVLHMFAILLYFTLFPARQYKPRQMWPWRAGLLLSSFLLLNICHTGGFWASTSQRRACLKPQLSTGNITMWQWLSI